MDITDNSDAVPEVVALAAEIAYVVDGGATRYRVDGLRMDESEAHSHLTKVRGVEAGAARSVLDLVRVRDITAARARLTVDYHVGLGYRICRRGRRMDFNEATDVLVREYRCTPDEAEGAVSQARANFDRFHLSYPWFPSEG
ncbi:hypothetical protein [Nocardiopsis suaedae]|uniref:Uncharacterized protein n=1 Tax=Nocardiopsis suaedae TaxID=3018444 RepID=A0ABT4TIC2_9ACTN|nr:hypothetical protein [Nocardiopsis suaedae]MDA2804460.1 hypothetical protein [Nocardiopsis suaedae]